MTVGEAARIAAILRKILCFERIKTTKNVHFFLRMTKKVIISADIENRQRYLF